MSEHVCEICAPIYRPKQGPRRRVPFTVNGERVGWAYVNADGYTVEVEWTDDRFRMSGRLR